ncbi:MAG TPA: amidohydrolase family protein [Terriglobales bacterium]|nr:amidohydrolase family protein [Terriglobales bacterium]
METMPEQAQLPPFAFQLRSALQFFLLIALAAAALAATLAAQATAPADAVLVHARIYTLNARQPWAEALAVRGGNIVAVGTEPQIKKYRGPSTRVIDAGGRLVLPGFTDCHIHFMDGSLSLERINVEDVKTIAGIQQRVKEFAAAHPKDPWILGRGWSYDVFGTAALPDKKYLDEVVPDRPVLLEGYDGHTYWANSKALQAAGINRNTPDPPNGKIVRDAQGEPTGALKEDAAVELVQRVVPQPTREERLQALRQGMAAANKAGLVRVHSAGGDFAYLDLLNQLRNQGQLTLRFYVSDIARPPELTADEIKKLEGARAKYHDSWISGGAVKFFLDGVVESHTAAMLQPYTDDPSQSGKLFWDPAKYKQAVAELNGRGFQIFTHAIGDRSVRLALDAYEASYRNSAVKDLRDRVEHIETISLADIPRFGHLGVIASMQPLHAYPDADTLKVWSPNIGPERTTRAWVWHSIAGSGGRLAFGSDWPVVTLSPWPGVQTALTRKTAEGTPAGGFVPSERITLPQVIEAYTLGAAYAGHREKTEGSLEPGKVADLIILNQDLFKIPANQTNKTQVLLTMVGGKVAYHALDFTGNAAPAGGK